MEIRPRITTKQLDFIQDPDLRQALRERLDELDRVFLVNASYSTVFVAIGSIEGILEHIAQIYRDDILTSPTYPNSTKGKKKQFKDLTVDELYVELKNLNILPDIPGYEQLYCLFRNYRNCIHPRAQIQKGWEIELGQAQMALGLLNATIQNLGLNVFIGKRVFEKIAGTPQYEHPNVIHLQVGVSRHHSFIVLKEPVAEKVHINFDLAFSAESLLNFVFNYENEANFKMLRLDDRDSPGYINGVLACSQKYLWRMLLHATPPNPPKRKNLRVEIRIDIPAKLFNLLVDGVHYLFKDNRGTQQDLFGQIEAGKRIGLFNEVGDVRLSDIQIQELS